MGSQRVRYNLATEQQQKEWNRIKIQESYIKIKIPFHTWWVFCVWKFLRSIVGYDAKCLFLVEDVTKVFLKISLIKSYLLIPFHTDMNISKAISSLFILNFLPFLPLLFFTHSGPAVFHPFLISVESRNSSCFHKGDKWSIPFFCQLNLYWSILQTPPNL